MIEILTIALVVVGAPIIVLGIVEFAYYPLALAFEARRAKEAVFDVEEPLVSVIVPAYNEERVIVNCVESILADDYARKEVVLVDDGSTDRTLELMRRYEVRVDVTVIAKPNGGKASALNAGLAHACGEVFFFVDADGIFTGETISGVLAGFDSADVAGVCGNDEPVNLDRPQTHLLALLTHGTAFVRRALARVNCLTIVSGNLGAFRRSVIDEIGGFTDGLIGEDLELTWRARRAGHRINFRPRALVYAEVPSTPGALWRQRVRWTRGLAQTARMHRDMLFSRRFGVVGWYLPFNLISMLAMPVLQLLALCLLAILIVSGNSPLSGDAIAVVGSMGLLFALVAVCAAVALDRAWRDLRYLYVIPMWLVYSLMMSLVTVWALVLEVRGAPSRWNKLVRTGVISRREVVDAEA